MKWLARPCPAGECPGTQGASTLRPDIQEINAWLAAIVGASSDAIISYAVDGTILAWNPAAERMFGYTAEEAIGQQGSLIDPPECAQEFPQLFGRLQAGQAIGDLEAIRIRKDGTRIRVRLNLAPIKTPDGIVMGISATVGDLTARKRAEERFKGLLDSAPDPILAVNRTGQIVFANLETEKLFGYAPAELLGAPIEILVPDRLREEHHRLREEYLVAPTTRPMGAGLDLRARRRDGTEFPVEISLSPLADADGPLIVAIVRDTTERTRAEEEHKRERAEIDRLKDDLSSMIVHDLKNPVNGIAMTVQTMLRRAGELSERQRKNLLGIEQTCREMLRLTQNLLEIAKIEAGKMPVGREAVDLAAVVRQVAAEYGQVAEQVGRRLVVAIGSDLPFATADAALLKRVLVNLVVNAIRHSGASEVRLEATPLPGVGELSVRVVDDGQGIPAEDQARIFEKFASVRRTPSGEPSADTGLGLPFCKLAVERMGGSIELTSAPGAATVFAVTLPVHARPS